MSSTIFHTERNGERATFSFVTDPKTWDVYALVQFELSGQPCKARVDLPPHPLSTNACYGDIIWAEIDRLCNVSGVA
jgi:hypothetical protein